MAGSPIKRMRHVERLRELGIEEVLERVASGKLYRAIAQELDVSYSALTAFLYEPQHAEALAAARKAGAQAHAEIALEDAEAESDPKMAGLVKVRADLRLRLAKADDPERFGDQRNLRVSGTVTVQDLHLQALRSRNQQALPGRAMPALPAPDPEPAAEADFEVLD